MVRSICMTGSVEAGGAKGSSALGVGELPSAVSSVIMRSSGMVMTWVTLVGGGSRRLVGGFGGSYVA